MAKIVSKKRQAELIPIGKMATCAWTSDNQLINIEEAFNMFVGNDNYGNIQDEVIVKESIYNTNSNEGWDFFDYENGETPELLLFEDTISVVSARTTQNAYFKLRGATTGQYNFGPFVDTYHSDALCYAVLVAISGTPGSAGSAITSVNFYSKNYSSLNVPDTTIINSPNTISYQFSKGEAFRVTKYGNIYLGFVEKDTIDNQYAFSDTYFKTFGTSANALENTTLFYPYNNLSTSQNNPTMLYVSSSWGGHV